MDFQLAGLDHVALRVKDLERSAAWYREVLGLQPMFEGAWGGVPIMLGIGGAVAIALFPARDAERATSGDIEIDHFAFRASRADFERARDSLGEKGVEVEFQDHEISHSIYFLDPDGHQLEITTYDF